MKPQILISAATAGSGKTLFAMGLLRALKNRGLKVQPYKCGPDFIDSQYLSIAADNESVNLDAWMEACILPYWANSPGNPHQHPNRLPANVNNGQQKTPD